VDIGREDMLYGARSGIQKAIRRGDLNLAKTCFDLLWSDDKQRDWLKWRIGILSIEDVFCMVGETGMAHKLKKSYYESETKMRRLVYSLCLAPKNKDAGGLWCVSKAKDVEYDHPEYALGEHVFNLSKTSIDAAARTIYAEMVEAIKDDMTPYELAALDAMKWRAMAGGMLGDRLMCLYSMPILACRRLNEEQVKDAVSDGAKKWRQKSGLKKPITVDLPWDAFDMHTYVGKVALGNFMKKKADKFGVVKHEVTSMWFQLQSAQLAPYLTTYRKIEGSEPTVFENIWRIEDVRLALTTRSHQPAYYKNLWEESIRDELKGFILWLLKQRATK
jgi:hypothetical protein